MYSNSLVTGPLFGWGSCDHPRLNPGLSPRDIEIDLGKLTREKLKLIVVFILWTVGAASPVGCVSQGLFNTNTLYYRGNGPSFSLPCSSLQFEKS